MSNSQIMALPWQIVVAPKGAGTNSATVEDLTGNNALTANGSTARLTTELGSLSINSFGSLTAIQKNRSSNTAQ